jgi:hypothetical protein
MERVSFNRKSKTVSGSKDLLKNYQRGYKKNKSHITVEINLR